MAHYFASYFRELVTGWIGLMSTLLGVLLNIIGWFFVPDVAAMRPYVIAVGVIALFIASFNAWLAKHKQLEQILATKPVIVTADTLEFDESSSLYRLLIRNTAKTTSPITAKIEQVILNGEPHPDSARLPIKLQWMHHPDRDSIELGSEKVDVAFVEIVPGPIAYPLKRIGYKDKEGRPRFRFPVSAAECYLVIAGATFHDFKICLKENESVNCELVVYGSENQPLSTKWCRFTRDSKAREGVVAEIVPLPPSLSR
jgi:hypothetical protein